MKVSQTMQIKCKLLEIIFKEFLKLRVVNEVEVGRSYLPSFHKSNDLVHAWFFFGI